MFRRYWSYYLLGSFEKALLPNPSDMIGGWTFSEMISVQAQKSRVTGQSQRHKPKSRVTGRQAELHPEKFDYAHKTPTWSEASEGDAAFL